MASDAPQVSTQAVLPTAKLVLDDVRCSTGSSGRWMRFRRPWAQMDDELSADFVEIGRSRRMGLAPQVLFAFLGVSGIYCIRGRRHESQHVPRP